MKEFIKFNGTLVIAIVIWSLCGAIPANSQDAKESAEAAKEQAEEAQEKAEKAEEKAEKATENSESAKKAAEEAKEANEETKKTLGDLIDRLEGQRSLRIGLSTGWRWIKDAKVDGRLDPSISPTDSLLYIQNGDRGSFVISMNLMSFPWLETKPKRWSMRNIGFVTNIDLVEVAGSGENGIFNSSVDGGIGLAYQFHNDFWIAATLEKFQNRTPRKHLIDRKGKM